MSDSPNFTAQSVGGFEVPSGRLIVADPVYLTHSDLAVVIDNAKPGRWIAMVGHAQIDGDGPRVSSLFVFHESDAVRDAQDDRELIYTIGVDTGRVCVVDSRAIGSYEDADLSPGYKPGPFGVMTPSGFGDWIYRCRVREHAGQAVSVGIVFIETEGDE